MEGTSGPTSLVKEGQLARIVPGLLLNIIEDGDFTASLLNLCQFLVTLTVERCFLALRRNLLSFVPLLLAITEKSPTSQCLHLPVMYFHTLIKPPPKHSLFQAEMSMCLSLSSYERCFSLFTIFAQLHWTVSRTSLCLLYWASQNWPQYFWCGLKSGESKNHIVQGKENINSELLMPKLD